VIVILACTTHSSMHFCLLRHLAGSTDNMELSMRAGIGLQHLEIDVRTDTTHMYLVKLMRHLLAHAMHDHLDHEER
jgi:hypothetical protein